MPESSGRKGPNDGQHKYYGEQNNADQELVASVCSTGKAIDHIVNRSLTELRKSVGYHDESDSPWND